MGFLEICLLGVGLSMDAFAVAICKGLNMKKINYWQGILIALFFGFFQFLMPVLGFYLGSQFEQYIQNFDHWIIFGLLLILGVKMIIEALKKEDDLIENEKTKNFILELFILSIATSLDALAVGITFAFLQVKVFLASLIIGIITFAFSFGGVVIGNFFGEKFKKPAEIIGGIILILIGVKVLLQHLGILFV